MRVLVAARLSQEHEGQTGLDSQDAEVRRWAEGKGHTVVAVVADHKTGKSNLWDRENLRPWVTEPAKLEQYDAIVAYKVDRLTRADKAGTNLLEEWARVHSKQLLISSMDAHFPSEGNDGIVWDIMLRAAHAEYLAIRERYLRMQKHKREAGSLLGRAPFGYDIIPGVNSDGKPIKTLEPNALGREWIPGMFRHAIDGKSLNWIARWLDSNGVRPEGRVTKWNEGTLSQLLSNPVYSGTRYADKVTTEEVDLPWPCKCHSKLTYRTVREHTKAHAGPKLMDVPALVSLSEQQQAKAVLASRVKLGRAPKGSGPKALLASLTCGNPHCLDIRAERQHLDDAGKARLAAMGPSPMYRSTSGHGDSRELVYVCTGRGPDRKGCGNQVKLAEADRLAEAYVAMLHDEPHRDSVWVPGDDKAEQLKKVQQRIAEAAQQGLYDALPALAAEAKALEAEPHVEAHMSYTDTGMSKADYYATLDADRATAADPYTERRAYLATMNVKALKLADGTIRLTMSDQAVSSLAAAGITAQIEVHD